MSGTTAVSRTAPVSWPRLLSGTASGAASAVTSGTWDAMTVVRDIRVLRDIGRVSWTWTLPVVASCHAVVPVIVRSMKP